MRIILDFGCSYEEVIIENLSTLKERAPSFGKWDLIQVGLKSFLIVSFADMRKTCWLSLAAATTSQQQRQRSFGL